MEEAITQNPRGGELIVAGDLNVDLGKESIQGSEEDITAAVATAGSGDLLRQFLLRPRAWCRNLRTGAMVRQGRVVRSRAD